MTTRNGTDNADTFDALALGDENVSNTYNGAGGADVLTGGYLKDFLDGGDGADTIHGGDGADVITDLLGVGNQIYGDEGDDTITEKGGSAIIDGGDGDDYIEAYDGSDQILTGAGDDYIFASYITTSGYVSVSCGAGDDFVSSYEPGYYYGDSGDDIFSVYGAVQFQIDGGQGDDVVNDWGAIVRFDGGAGEDLVTYYNEESSVTINLLTNVQGGSAAGDSLIRVEDIIGSNYADTITGNGAINDLEGGSGADIIDGGAGGDYLDGGTDLQPALAAPADEPQESIDIVSYVGSDAGVTVNLTSRLATGGDAQGDTLFNFEGIRGSDFNDSLTGTTGANALFGGAGADRLLGGDGADQLFGENGADLLSGGGGGDIVSGGDGADRVQGGGGADQLTGGLDADVFAYTTLADSTYTIAGRDVIMDFKRSEGDKIDLSMIDANATAANDQAFTFIGTQAFHNVAGELRYLVSGANIIVSGDVNGDGAVDFAITIKSGALQAGDFIL